jgi:outer membrane protein assembly factor BamB
VTGLHLATGWEASPPKQVWRHRVGPAWSSVAIVDGMLFTQEQIGKKEAVVCYDAATGTEVWTHEDDGRFKDDLSGVGPRGTPTFAEGRLFTLGARGRLNCLDAATGKEIWSHDVVSDAGAAAPMWGLSNSPLVVGSVVVVFAGGNDQSLRAYRTDNGSLAWSCAVGKDSYSSPQMARLAGETVILMMSDRGLFAVDPEKGSALWEQSVTDDKANLPIAQPQVVGDGQILVALASGLSLFDVQRSGDQWKVERRWQSRGIKPSLNDVVVDRDRIFGFDDGIFCCLDLKTGKRAWKDGRYGHGQVLLIADQHLLFVTSEKGEVVLLAANPERHEELASFPAIKGKTWNHPVISGGRLYVRNAEEMACYELPVESTARR